MKVGIVTVHDSSNMGSYLQALAMQELIKQHGDTPYIIKTRSLFSTLCLFLGYNNSKPVRSIKTFILFFLSSIKHYKKTKEKYQKYKTYSEDWKIFENIISVRKANKMNLDRILLGSDEIWNVNKPAFQNPYMYGMNLKADKKITYAISIGNATKEQLLQFPHLNSGISKLDGIIYRDVYTSDVLTDMGFKTTARICDPTLQVDIRKYMKQEQEVELPEEKYIAVYSYSVDKTTRQWIERFAKENGLKIVAVSLPQKWCDFYSNCSPLEFGAVLKNASFVYTNTFHGTIFSCLYHTNFVSLANLPKIKDVLSLLGLEKHSLPDDVDYETFSNMLKCQRDYNDMEERLANWRKESFDLYEKFVK